MEKTFPGVMDATLTISILAFAIMAGLFMASVLKVKFESWWPEQMVKNLDEHSRDSLLISFWAVLFGLFAKMPTYIGLHDVTKFHYVLSDGPGIKVVFEGYVDGLVWSSLIEVTGVAMSVLCVLMSLFHLMSDPSTEICLEKE